MEEMDLTVAGDDGGHKPYNNAIDEQIQPINLSVDTTKCMAIVQAYIKSHQSSITTVISVHDIRSLAIPPHPLSFQHPGPAQVTLLIAPPPPMSDSHKAPSLSNQAKGGFGRTRLNPMCILILLLRITT